MTDKSCERTGHTWYINVVYLNSGKVTDISKIYGVFFSDAIYVLC